MFIQIIDWFTVGDKYGSNIFIVWDYWSDNEIKTRWISSNIIGSGKHLKSFLMIAMSYINKVTEMWDER